MKAEFEALLQSKSYMNKVAQQIINIHGGGYNNPPTPEEDKELKNHMLMVAQQYVTAKQGLNEAYSRWQEAQRMKELGWKAGLGTLGAGAVGAGLGMLPASTPEGKLVGGALGGIAGLVGGGIAMGKLNRSLYPETFAARAQTGEAFDGAVENLRDMREQTYEAANLNPEMWNRQRVVSGLSGLPSHRELYRQYDEDYLEEQARQRQEAIAAALAAKTEASAQKEKPKEEGDKEASFTAEVDYLQKTAKLLELYM